MTYEHTRLPRRAAEVIDAIIEDVRKSWPRDGAEGEGVHALIDEIEYLRADLLAREARWRLGERFKRCVCGCTYDALRNAMCPACKAAQEGLK